MERYQEPLFEESCLAPVANGIGAGWRPDTCTAEAALSRGDESNVRKISAKAGGVPRDQSSLFDFGMCSDVEIRQRRGLCTPRTPVFHKCLRCQPARRIRQWQSPENRRIKPSVQIGGARKSRSQFGVDDRVDENRPLNGGGAKLQFRPGHPCGIRCGDVQKDVRVEKIHSSPRVRAITFAVVSPERAAPRARCNQLSTGAGVARRTRSVSSQPANSSTCGAGSFSMASSISAILLLAGIYHVMVVNGKTCPRPPQPARAVSPLASLAGAPPSHVHVEELPPQLLDPFARFRSKKSTPPTRGGCDSEPTRLAVPLAPIRGAKVGQFDRPLTQYSRSPYPAGVTLDGASKTEPFSKHALRRIRNWRVWRERSKTRPTVSKVRTDTCTRKPFRFIMREMAPRVWCAIGARQSGFSKTSVGVKSEPTLGCTFAADWEIDRTIAAKTGGK